MCLFYSNPFPGCHYSDSMGPEHIQVLSLISNWTGSQHSYSALAFGGMILSAVLADRCAVVIFAPFLSLFLPLIVLLIVWFFLLVLDGDIISFIGLVVLLMSVYNCGVCFLVSAAINSSVVLACSSIMFALKFFAIRLFCLFSFTYSTNMNVLMFCF